MARTLAALIARAADDRPVMIAGATASGKSALGLALAEAAGGIVVNADALQVYEPWRILTARPDRQDEARVPHVLYGHVQRGQPYSVGAWLREVAPLITAHRQGRGPRPIILGGTGLYFSALTEGLADIPPIQAEIRAEADSLLAADGLARMIAELDPATAQRIDLANPIRVQRAWEVLRATGRGLADWQQDTGPALQPLTDALAVVIDQPRDILAERIERRFDAMLAAGLLDEVLTELPHWSPALPYAKAIGAAEMVTHLRGELSLDAARTAVISATRDYARRQRKWFRSRMGHWPRIGPQSPS